MMMKQIETIQLQHYYFLENAVGISTIDEKIKQIILFKIHTLFGRDDVSVIIRLLPPCKFVAYVA
jgi:hypothetical protein